MPTQSRNRNRQPAPVRATPAPAAPAESRTRVTAPVIDYSALQSTDVAADAMPKGSRKSALDGTPFVAWMKESKDRNVGKAVTVPAAAVKQTVYLIRAAARELNCGVTIRERKTQDGNVSVAFKSKDKRVNNTAGK